MGQPITVLGTTVLGEVVLIDTDRSITGQDGSTYQSPDEATDDFPGRLAARIFGQIDRVTHVFVASNQVVVGRDGGWDDAALQTASEVVTEFFVFYEGQEAAEAASPPPIDR
jgi:hypothetical protein